MKKRYLFSLLLILSPILAAAQGGVVSAPVLESLEGFNKGTLLKQLAEVVKQTEVLKDTYDKMKGTLELYEKVSDKLKQVEMVQKAIQRQADLVNACSDALKNVKKSKGATSEDLVRVRKSINDIIATYKMNLDLINKVLTTDLLKMDDNSRITLLMDITDRTEKSMRKVNSTTTAFEHVSAVKAMLKQNY